MSYNVSTRESLQSQWEEFGNLEAHLNSSNVALQWLEDASGLVLPETDRRWQLGLARLTIAKEGYNGVQAIGEYAGMKSTFGNMLMGTDSRIDVDPGDMATDFFGHVHPAKQSADVADYIPGKISKAAIANPDAGTFHLSEVGNMRNQRPLGRLYEEGKTLQIDDERVLETSDSAFYLAMNFADNSGVHGLSRNLQSRNPNQIVVGDGSVDFYKRAGSAQVNYSMAPLLPKLAVRREIGKLVDETYVDPYVEDGVTLSSNFTVDLLAALNETGLIKRASLGDVRVIQAMKAASQAYLYDRDAQQQDHGNVSETRIDEFVVAAVAAFVLPTAVQLNEVAEYNFRANTGNIPTQLEKAIAIRHLISKTAMTMVFEGVRAQAINQAAGKRGKLDDLLTEVNKSLAGNIAQHTYADISALDHNPDEVYLNHSDKAAKTKGATKHGKRTLFGRSR